MKYATLLMMIPFIAISCGKRPENYKKIDARWDQELSDKYGAGPFKTLYYSDDKGVVVTKSQFDDQRIRQEITDFVQEQWNMQTSPDEINVLNAKDHDPIKCNSYPSESLKYLGESLFEDFDATLAYTLKNIPTVKAVECGK